MQRTVKVFVIPRVADPQARPSPARTSSSRQGTGIGSVRPPASSSKPRGYRVRSLSFGLKGLVAYVEPVS